MIDYIQMPDVVLITNRPRLTFTKNSACIERMLSRMSVAGTVSGECPLWAASMQDAILRSISAELRGDIPHFSFYLFTDYDTPFELEDVQTMYKTIRDDDTIDAIYPVQAARHWDRAIVHGYDVDYSTETTDVPLGHFGLTFVRRSAFGLTKDKNNRAAHLPWFMGIPNRQGLWLQANEHDPNGMVADDMYFWNSLRTNGGRIVLHNRIQVGHMGPAVMWAEGDGNGGTKIRWQTMKDYEAHGKPDDLAPIEYYKPEEAAV